MKKKKSILIDEKPSSIQKIDLAESGVPEVKITEPSKVVVHQTIQQPEKHKHTTAESKPSFQKPVSISISAPIVTSSPEPVYEIKNTEPVKIEDKPFTFDELEVVWLKFSETISDQGRMKSFILSTKPQLISDTEFQVTVSNTLQEKELKKLEPDLLAFIRMHLQNKKVQIRIHLAELSEIQRANSPEDRYKILAQQNPALDILKNGLQLEID